MSTKTIEFWDLKEKIKNKTKGFGRLHEWKINASLSPTVLNRAVVNNVAKFPKLKKYIWIIILLLSCSCSQKRKIVDTVQGNWQISSNTAMDSILYLEAFIDSSRIHIYMNPVGTIPSTSYYIKNDSLYLNILSDSIYTNAGKISLNNNILKITNGKGVTTYRKLESKHSLDEFRNKEIDEYQFGPAFYDRMENWERRHSIKTIKPNSKL